MSYDNNMQLIVSKVVSDNTKAPTLRATVEIDGQKYKAGLWVWKRKDGSSVTDKAGNNPYIGKLEVDDYEGKSQPADSAPPAPDDFNDDIPF